MTVMLNKSDPDIREWVSDPNAQPIAYVYGFKTRAPCGTALKPINQNGPPNYNFTIPYGAACNLFLSDLEPNYLATETTISIEDNAVRDESKPMRINHVYCLYTAEIQALKVNDISRYHKNRQIFQISKILQLCKFLFHFAYQSEADFQAAKVKKFSKKDSRKKFFKILDKQG